MRRRGVKPRPARGVGGAAEPAPAKTGGEVKRLESEAESGAMISSANFVAARRSPGLETFAQNLSHWSLQA